MALQFEELIKTQKKIDNLPLSDEELAYVQETEEYIDTKILSNLKSQHTKIYIDLCIATFVWSPVHSISLKEKISDRRRLLMIEELNRRFFAAGWVLDYEYANELNFESDYLVLRGNMSKSC